MQAIGEAGFEVPIIAWGGEYGISVTHPQCSVIADDVRGGVIPGAGHLVPEEAPEFLATEFDAFFDEVEAQ